MVREPIGHWERGRNGEDQSASIDVQITPAPESLRILSRLGASADLIDLDTHGFLMQLLEVKGSQVGLDLSHIASALEDFCVHYEQGPWSDGSTPLSPPMLNKICSIIQSSLYPIMPVEADTFLEHVEQGFKTLDVGKMGLRARGGLQRDL